MSRYRRGQNWSIVWGLYLFSPIILLFTLFGLNVVANLFLGYVSFFTDVLGIPEKSLLLIAATFGTPVFLVFIGFVLYTNLRGQIQSKK